MKILGKPEIPENLTFDLNSCIIIMLNKYHMNMEQIQLHGIGTQNTTILLVIVGQNPVQSGNLQNLSKSQVTLEKVPNTQIRRKQLPS